MADKGFFLSTGEDIEPSRRGFLKGLFAITTGGILTIAAPKIMTAVEALILPGDDMMFFRLKSKGGLAVHGMEHIGVVRQVMLDNAGQAPFYLSGGSKYNEEILRRMREYGDVLRLIAKKA